MTFPLMQQKINDKSIAAQLSSAIKNHTKQPISEQKVLFVTAELY
jgi:hypothetical protein